MKFLVKLFDIAKSIHKYYKRTGTKGNYKYYYTKEDYERENKINNKSIKKPLKQTDTKEFKEWFGDSKVVDENGEPLVVYHGTENFGFKVFDFEKSGGSVFLSNNKRTAESYSNNKKNVYKLYAAIKKPLIINSDGDSWHNIKIPKNIQQDMWDFLGEMMISTNTENYTKFAKNKGFDGVIINNIYDSNSYNSIDDFLNKKSNIYIVFNPTQIKSAIGNNGNFDKNNPDITKSIMKTKFIINKKKIEKSVNKGFDIDIEKADLTPEQKKKVEKVMHEWKQGTLKTSTGELVTDQKQALAIAISESKKIKKSMELADMEPLRKEDLENHKLELHAIVRKKKVDVKDLLKQLEIGFNVEKEHGKDKDKRIKTVIDHLNENLHYYTDEKPKDWGLKELKAEKIKKSLIKTVDLSDLNHKKTNNNYLPLQKNEAMKVEINFNELKKSLSHKYKSRKPDGKGGWIYEYNKPATKETSKTETMKKKLDIFLAKFPNDTKKWSEATDEIRDIARKVKESYNEFELNTTSESKNALQPIDFRNIKTPSEWNTKGKAYIEKVYNSMSEKSKERFLNELSDIFPKELK